MIAKQLGFAEYVNKKTVNAQEILAEMSKILSNDSYRKEIAKVKSFFVDRIMDPMKEAVFSTERLLRIGDRHIFDRAGMRQSWQEFLYIDVLALILGSIAFVGCMQ